MQQIQTAHGVVGAIGRIEGEEAGTNGRARIRGWRPDDGPKIDGQPEAAATSRSRVTCEAFFGPINLGRIMSASFG